MRRRRGLAAACAVALLFAAGFGAAREIGATDDEPQASVTLSAVAARHPATFRAPDLAGTPAALAAPPRTTRTTTPAPTGTGTTQTQTGTYPQPRTGGGTGGSGAKTISSGDQ